MYHHHTQLPLKTNKQTNKRHSKVATGTTQMPSWAQWHIPVISEFRRLGRLEKFELESSLSYKSKDPFSNVLTFCCIDVTAYLAIVCPVWWFMHFKISYSLSSVTCAMRPQGNTCTTVKYTCTLFWHALTVQPSPYQDRYYTINAGFFMASASQFQFLPPQRQPLLCFPISQFSLFFECHICGVLQFCIKFPFCSVISFR